MLAFFCLAQHHVDRIFLRTCLESTRTKEHLSKYMLYHWGGVRKKGRRLIPTGNPTNFPPTSQVTKSGVTDGVCDRWSLRVAYMVNFFLFFLGILWPWLCPTSALPLPCFSDRPTRTYTTTFIYDPPNILYYFYYNNNNYYYYYYYNILLYYSLPGQVFSPD